MAILPPGKAQALGTALLLISVIGSGIMGASLADGNTAIALLANAIATGCMLYVIITTLGPISGAHFNPAVSLAFVTLFGFLAKRLSWKNFVTSMRETAFQSAALFFIAVGAKIFVSFVSLNGVTSQLVELVAASGLENWQVLLCIVFIYLIMGMFLDPIGTMLLTLPFVVPLVEGMGYDLIWFGVIVIKLLEIGLITPPVGLNVFVINSVVGKAAQVHTIFFGVMKFLVLDIVVLLLLLSFPILSLYVPNTMF